MDKIKLWSAFLLGGLFFLFAFQNMASVEVQFLFWSFETRRFLMLFVTLVLGFSLGWLTKAHGRHRGKPAKSDDKAAPNSS